MMWHFGGFLKGFGPVSSGGGVCTPATSTPTNSRLHIAADRLITRQLRTNGQDATYYRGAASVELTAIVSKQVYDQGDTEQQTSQIAYWDFIIRASDLVLSAAQATPQRGDRFQTSIDGILQSFAVSAIDGDQLYEPSDHGGRIWRIHTTLTGLA